MRRQRWDGPAILVTLFLCTASSPVTAAEPPPVHINGNTLPGPFIPVFGVARYRASIPYLALAPRKTFSVARSHFASV